MEAKAFAEAAQPHSWFLVADDLHEQAARLHARRDGGGTTRTNCQSGDRIFWDATNRTVFLVAGFALENALKAFLVYEHPHWISNGMLSKQLRSHALVQLAELSTHAPYKKRGRPILRQFESGLESWARYPCGLSASAETDPAVLDERLWARYLCLISAYGRRLQKLLSREWQGPHGIGSSFEFRGEVLGSRGNQHRPRSRGR